MFEFKLDALGLRDIVGEAKQNKHKEYLKIGQNLLNYLSSKIIEVAENGDSYVKVHADGLSFMSKSTDDKEAIIKLVSNWLCDNTLFESSYSSADLYIIIRWYEHNVNDKAYVNEYRQLLIDKPHLLRDIDAKQLTRKLLYNKLNKKWYKKTNSPKHGDILRYKSYSKKVYHHELTEELKWAHKTYINKNSEIIATYFDDRTPSNLHPHHLEDEQYTFYTPIGGK